MERPYQRKSPQIISFPAQTMIHHADDRPIPVGMPRYLQGATENGASHAVNGAWPACAFWAWADDTSSILSSAGVILHNRYLHPRVSSRRKDLGVTLSSPSLFAVNAHLLVRFELCAIRMSLLTVGNAPVGAECLAVVSFVTQEKTLKQRTSIFS